MLKLLRKSLLQLIAPSFCFYCHDWTEYEQPLCAKCSRLITPVVSEEIVLSATCKIRVYAAGRYEEPLKSLILAKHHGNSIASKQLGALMIQRLPLQTIDGDLLVPVPLHWTRYAKRGFNQAEVMAQELGACIKKPVVAMLKRVKCTQFQASLPAQQRFANVTEAFEIEKSNRNLIDGKHVILVDDLMTTGSTLRSAAQTLFGENPRSLSVLLACRAL